MKEIEGKDAKERNYKNEKGNERTEMLKNRFNHIKKGTEKIEKDGFHLYFRTDNIPRNQGRCFYNFNTDTYYVGVRKWRGANITAQLVIERQNPNSGHTRISFCITGNLEGKEIAYINLYNF